MKCITGVRADRGWGRGVLNVKTRIRTTEGMA